MDALERVKYVLAQLPREDQARLAAFLNETLLTDEEAAALLAPDRVVATVTTRRRSPTITYREERVRCGKKGCTKCPHGPYVYKYWREDGRLRKAYVGKRSTPDAGGSPRPDAVTGGAGRAAGTPARSR